MATTLVKSLRGDRVSGLRLRDVCRARPSDRIDQVVQCMIQQRTGCVLVIGDDGRLAGIFTERDFVTRVVAQGLDVSQPVQNVMTPKPRTIARNATVLQVVELMGTDGYRHMPVIGEDGQPVGVLSVKDVVHYLVEYFPAKVYNLPPTPEHTQPAREGA
jgi:CBS domain-containing protein